MSLARQVLSSPFDCGPSRPRTAPERGSRKSHLMKDNRIRFKTMCRSNYQGKDEGILEGVERPGPGTIIFDSRLIKADLFANPIVMTQRPRSGSPKGRSRRISGKFSSPPSTPPPVKGRHHKSVQTDKIEAGILDHLMVVTSCV